MADDFLKVKKGLNVRPQASPPSNAENGDVFYEDSRGTHTVISSGQPMDLSSSAAFAAVASMTSANFTAAVLRSNTIILTGGTAGTIHGMTAMPAGRMVNIVNATNQNIAIAHQSGTEGTAANRISTPNGINQTLNPGGSLPFVRDNTIGTWRAVFPTPPVVAKRSGVLTWNWNDVNQSFLEGFSSTEWSGPDGFRFLPKNTAVNVYAVTLMATAGPLFSGSGFPSYTLSPRTAPVRVQTTTLLYSGNTTTWTDVGTPYLTTQNNRFTNTVNPNLNIAANYSSTRYFASGYGNFNSNSDGAGIIFRAVPITSGSFGGHTVNWSTFQQDVTISLFWVEQ